MADDQHRADSTDMTFAEIAEKFGEEAAINAGIAADPDTREIGAETGRRMRPASEAIPGFVARWRRSACGNAITPPERR